MSVSEFFQICLQNLIKVKKRIIIRKGLIEIAEIDLDRRCENAIFMKWSRKDRRKNISLRAKRARLSFCVPSFENTHCAKRGRCAVGDAEFPLGLIQIASELTKQLR